MSDNKTQPTTPDFDSLITALPDNRAAEARTLDAVFRRVSGSSPVVWRGGLIGYGSYEYTYASGRSGSSLATGFAARKAALSIYIMPGYADLGAILDRLGPHKMGKSCLTITRLSRIDTNVLAELITAGLADLRKLWPVRT